MVTKKANDEDKNLGSVQAPQEGDTDKQLDTPVSDQPVSGEMEAPSEQDHQEDGNPDASTKPGEAKGRATDEQVAAEKAPETAEETNPVAEATERESKDPYAEGKHIANPEPNNGRREDGEEAPLPSANPDTPSQEELDQKTADTIADQKHVEANTDGAK